MNAQTIDLLYNEIIKLPNGVERIKIDLHVHTPASKDFINNTLSTEEAYFNVLDEALKHSIRIIAITDHNTFSGIQYIRRAMTESPELLQKYKNLKILCGIEITCFSKHLIAIFPDDFDEEKQNLFLHDIGIEKAVEGLEDALADRLGPALLIEKINEYGGFAILAHADNAKGFLQDLCGKKVEGGELSFNGKSLAKIIKSPALLGVQYCSDKNLSKLIDVLHNKDYKRDTNDLAFLKCSDCHGVCIDGSYSAKSGKAIGKNFSNIKLSEISFDSLKMALADSEMRVCTETESSQYPYILGVAVSSPIFRKTNGYSCFHFSKELNCIIGSRGTGKTTLLEIIQSIVMPNSLKANDHSQALRKYNSAIVFLKNQDIVYAIHNKTKSNCNGYTNEIEYSSEFKIYSKKTSDKKFKIDKSSMDTEFLKMFLTAGYQQRQLFDYSRNPNKILDIVDDFINWKHHKNYQSILGQLENRYSRLEELLNNIRKNHSATGSKFVEYIDNHGQVSEINNIINIINTKKEELHNLRVKMIDELNKVLLGKVKLSLSKRTSTFADKKQIENLCGRAKNMQGKTYEYFLKLKKILEKIYVLSEYEDSFVFYSMLLDSNFSNIIERYKLSDIEEEDLMAIRKVLDEDDVLVFLDDQLKMEYNINAGTGFDENFKDNSMISMGQNAVALLLLILNAAYNMDDNRPLLMDQPEDDLDNSYIYSTLVKEFRNSKTKRQVIISTHNPNIPVAADAETIMVLEFDGEHGYLENVGSIDSSKTANKVLSIMEGGQEAIQRRVDKYNL